MQFIAYFIAILFGLCQIGSADETRPKKLLVLIIASDNVPVYREFYKSWRSYMHSYPGLVEAYFLKGDATLSVPVKIEGDTIWCRVDDDFHPLTPGIINKTIMAFEELLPRIRKDFDYVLRTNLSSFYVFPRLFQFLNALPATRCYAGSRTGPESFILSGAGFILSPDLVEMIVENKRTLFNNIKDGPDDCVIGFFMKRHDIPILHTYKRVDILGLDDWKMDKEKGIPEEWFHFRVKSSSNRRIPDDLIVHSELFQMFYGEQDNL